MRNLFKIAGLLALTGFISSCNDKETTANYQVIPLPVKCQCKRFMLCKAIISMYVFTSSTVKKWRPTSKWADQGWRLEIKKYPKLTEIGSKRSETVIGRNSGEYDGKPYGGFYTQEEADQILPIFSKPHTVHLYIPNADKRPMLPAYVPEGQFQE